MRGGWCGKRWRLRMLKLRRRNIWLLKKQREVASKPSASTTPGSATISLFGIGLELFPKASVPSGTGTITFTAAERRQMALIAAIDGSGLDGVL
eukprot:CAMPEP_0172521280 /NCGR_PEP_ID=MMETSP1066-20121228/292491_1 /TAXON_ID=671091 /ORGANISM="Coscinodiscus wailesii, Strain CCMP2513" /LENGTH=93 /DNA_ID=CAMNT_0013304177 /DNA_START=1192 /DNA_END=1473 /DNA_ORIENTATION=+